jgi:hypothetical protein
MPFLKIKVINPIYIDQLNQDYDNPSTKRINCPISKRKDLRDRAKIILKADSGSETNDKDYVFSILF